MALRASRTSTFMVSASRSRAETPGSRGFYGRTRSGYFYRDGPRESGPWKAALLKLEYIPSELLTMGDAFAVIDNGETITKGTITEVYRLAVCS